MYDGFFVQFLFIFSLASTAAPTTYPQPPSLSSRRLRISKEAVELLLASMQFQPFDTAQFPATLTPRAMFLFLRAVVSMHQLPVAVASPLLSLQKVLGKNTVSDVGMKLHKPRGEAHYMLVPYPFVAGNIASMDIVNDVGIQWVSTSANGNSTCLATGSGHTRAREELYRRLRPD
jgi:hypothetical protein